jgi:hypothetical protein
LNKTKEILKHDLRLFSATEQRQQKNFKAHDLRLFSAAEQRKPKPGAGKCTAETFCAVTLLSIRTKRQVFVFSIEMPEKK